MGWGGKGPEEQLHLTCRLPKLRVGGDQAVLMAGTRHFRPHSNTYCKAWILSSTGRLSGNCNYLQILHKFYFFQIHEEGVSSSYCCMTELVQSISATSSQRALGYSFASSCFEIILSNIAFAIMENFIYQLSLLYSLGRKFLWGKYQPNKKPTQRIPCVITSMWSSRRKSCSLWINEHYSPVIQCRKINQKFLPVTKI